MRYTIQHNGETHTTPDLPADFTLAQLKAQAAERWPEVANSTVQVTESESGSNIVTFRLAQGNKAV